MGFDNKPKVAETFQPENRGYDQMAMNLMNQFLSGQNTPQVGTNIQAPDMPLHERAATQMGQSIDQYGPAMEKFMYGMMQGGGRQNLDNMTRAMRQQGRMNDQQTLNDVKASGIPMRSSGMEGAAAQALAQNRLQRNMQMGQMELDNERYAQQNQWQGAQGLSGMPGYYAQPSSIEASMLGLRQPYDMANIQNERFNAEMQNQQQGYGANLMGQFLQNNWYQPERVMYNPYNFARDTLLPGMFQFGGAALGAGLSDVAYKESILGIENPGEKIDKLRGVTYRWTPSARFFGAEYTGEDAGVIAQEVEEVIPEAVIEVDGVKRVSYPALTGLVIEEIKSLRQRVSALEGE